jgi:hypothetical protein
MVSKPIVIATEMGSSLPVVVGDCPSCGVGERSMVLIDFVPNGYRPEHSTIYFKCVCCMTITQKKICEVSESS